MLSKFPYLLMISLFILVSQFCLAQWKVGLQTGVNISTYNIENKSNSAELETKTGLILGGVINYLLNNQFEINSGIRYIQKGAHLVFTTSDYIQYFYYLEIPVHLKYSFTTNDIKPFVSAGFDCSSLLLAKLRSNIDENTFEENNTEEYDKLEVSLNGGIGIEYEARNNISYILSSNYCYAVYKENNKIINKGLHLIFSVLYKF